MCQIFPDTPFQLLSLTNIDFEVCNLRLPRQEIGRLVRDSGLANLLVLLLPLQEGKTLLGCLVGGYCKLLLVLPTLLLGGLFRLSRENCFGTYCIQTMFSLSNRQPLPLQPS